jgi:hypothetical protein
MQALIAKAEPVSSCQLDDPERGVGQGLESELIIGRAR